MREPTERLLQVIGYNFGNPQLADYALTHRSVGGINNERLEFLGDAILGFVVADELYARFKEADEGQLSRMRAGLVKGESLATLARDLELGKYLKLGAGELRSGGQSRNSILADALEALLAAIYLDGGYDAVRQVTLHLFQERLESISPDSHQKDPKTRLQEFLQGRGLGLPAYKIMDIDGEQHDQLFRVKCIVEDLSVESEGQGGSRRKAEQDAAGQVLEQVSKVAAK
ncbi:ribonuclease III [Pseudomonadota bacterium]